MSNILTDDTRFRHAAIFAAVAVSYIPALLGLNEIDMPGLMSRGPWRGSDKPIKAYVRPPEPEPPVPKDAQIVETPDQPDVTPTPVSTRFLSNKTTRTEHETKSANAAKAARKAPANVAIGRPSAVQSEKSKSPDPTVTSKDKTSIEVASGSDIRPTSVKGAEKTFETVLDKAKASQLLLPPGSDEATRANLQALAGDWSSTDHIEGVDAGHSTVLNADTYKYADFFNRVKTAVERHWQPSDVYLQRDPTGQLYGVKDRYTVLRVELDHEGRLVALTTIRQSGLDFMDDEAKKSFREAAPFLNPPQALSDSEGRIRFEFGFYFEIVAGKYRFNWRRL